MSLDNLNDDPMRDVLARLRALETADPLGFSSITRGQLRVGGSAILLVDSDGGVVIHGQLNGDGTLVWTGVTTLKGTTRFEGDTTQVGPFHIEGATDLKGDMAVKSGGKITVEGANPIILSQVAGAAQMQLGDAKLIGGANGFALGVGTRVVYSSLDGVVLQGGLNTLSVNSSTGTQISGALDLENLPTMARGSLVPNLYIDPTSKQVYRLV
ncbi:hypothetical protein EV379_1254 [Microterricola gilva]|uniref:Uncharacterized protein n=1 Tax=Microterricola gilva TaxID=393267 RepID=A0A4Q8ALV5_9MICO|nr:hypothetical protein [Microterricola gilva]RZU64943.1 hypothetical protein EV379_1254 [Microterricola gilva]